MPQFDFGNGGLAGDLGSLNSLADFTPDHLAPVADTATKAAETYASQAQKSLEKANKAKTVAGILQLVGGLANSANQIYQGTKRRIPLPIGDPFKIAGQGVQGLVAEPALASYQKYSGKAAVENIPGMDPTLKSALMASVDAGQPEAGFKGALEAMKENKFNPDIAFINGTMTPEQRANYVQMQGLKRPNYTTPVDLKASLDAQRAELNALNTLLNDPIKSAMISPDVIAQYSTRRDQLRQSLDVPLQAPQAKPNALGKKPAAQVPQAALPPRRVGETPDQYTSRTGIRVK